MSEQHPAYRPRLVIPMGDPAGIGPEVVLKSLADSAFSQAADLTVVGDRALLSDLYQQLRQQAESMGSAAPATETADSQALADPAHLQLIDVPLSEVSHSASSASSIRLGKETVLSGAASFQYLERAIADTLAGEFDGIVTAPIAKSAWQAAGHNYPGQTERLAERAGVERFGMLFAARSPHTQWSLRALLATTHIPLSQVPATLTPALMTQKLDLLVQSLRQDFGVDAPRIAISGLNPHSGEQGQLGQEEQAWLIPWIDAARQRYPHLQLDGPIPPDTLWVRPGQAWFQTSSSPAQVHDAYVALYHDQGLIPVKLMAFDRAVNTTIGLPFVRTSPDHGTAFDIAGQGIADPTSMKAALQLAIEIVHHRQLENSRILKPAVRQE